MVICESYMFECSVSKDMRKRFNNDKRRIPTYLLTLIVKKLKVSVEQGRVVTTLNVSKHQISYLVYLSSTLISTISNSLVMIHRLNDST